MILLTRASNILSEFEWLLLVLRDGFSITRKKSPDSLHFSLQFNLVKKSEIIKMLRISLFQKIDKNLIVLEFFLLMF